MTAQEYVIKNRELQRKINALTVEQVELRIAYYKENVPYPLGTIVRIHFKDGGSLKGVIGGKWEINHDTGEFRPNLCSLTKEGGRGSHITYSWQREIDHIEELGKAATCSDCIWRELDSDGVHMYCRLQMSCKDYDLERGDVYAEVQPDNLACSRCNFVKWENNIPWQRKFKPKKR